MVKLLGNCLYRLSLLFMIGAVPSVGIIISHFGVLYWMPHELGTFLAWSVGTGIVVFSNPCRWFFFWPRIAFSTCFSHVCQSVLSWMFKWDPRRSKLCVYLSLLWYSVLLLLLSLFSLDSQLYLLNSGTLPSSAYISLLYAVACAFSQGISWGCSWVSPHVFPAPRGSLLFCLIFSVL